MPLHVVVVEIQAESLRSDLTEILLSACTRAALDADCVAADNDAPDDARALARVQFHSTNVEIDVTYGNRPTSKRTLRFTPSDGQSARFQSVGLVVGTLYSAEADARDNPGATEPAGVEDEPRAPSKSVNASPATLNEAEPAINGNAEKSTLDAEEKQGAEEVEDQAKTTLPLDEPASAFGVLHGWLDAEAFVAPGLAGPRAGAEIAGAAMFTKHLFGAAHVAYSWNLRETDRFEANWLSFGAGAGYAFHEARWLFAPRLELFGKILSAARPEESSPTERRGVAGARATFDATYFPIERVGVVVGASATWATGSTEVALGSETLGTDSQWGYGLRAGVRLRF